MHNSNIIGYNDHPQGVSQQDVLFESFVSLVCSLVCYHLPPLLITNLFSLTLSFDPLAHTSLSALKYVHLTDTTIHHHQQQAQAYER